MDDNRVSRREGPFQIFQQFFSLFTRPRYTTISDRKRDKADAFLFAAGRFFIQAEVVDLTGRQKTYNRINARGSPSLDLVFKPVAASRTRRNSEAACPRTFDPI